MPQEQTPSGLQTLVERQFKGLNLSAGPEALQDGEFLELDNCIPYADGAIVVLPGAQLVVGALPTSGITIAGVWTAVIGDVLYIIGQGEDGSVWSFKQGDTTWQAVAPAGSTTVDGLHFVHWKGEDVQGNPEAVLWVDTTFGYGSWTGSSWTVLVSTLKGQALTIYSGRVWIASGSTVNFTAPGAYNDFNVADMAGSFAVTDPTMNGPVVALEATQNWLYIIGNGMMALNNVQVTSVTSSTADVTTYYLTPVSESVSIQNSKAALVWDNVLMLTTGTGLWAYYGLNGRNLAENMGDNFSGGSRISAATVFGTDVLVIDTGYNCMLKKGEWFTTLYGARQWVDLDFVNYQGMQSFITDGNAVYQLFQNETAVRTCTINTKLFDCGNAAINKRLMKIGLEVYDSELLGEPVSGPLPSVSIEPKGYVARGAVQTWPLRGVLSNTGIFTNQWITFDAPMTDRYLGVTMILTAKPGIALGMYAMQFADGAVWPTDTSAIAITGGMGLSGALTPTGTSGVPWTGQLTITGNYTAPVAVTGYPAWTTYSVSGRTINFSGTPPA